MPFLRAALALVAVSLPLGAQTPMPAPAPTSSAPVVFSTAPSAAGTTTVILVRHAEKAAEPAADPPLTDAGVARAESLIDILKDAGVRAIITTQWARTRATAAPLAERIGVVPEIVDTRSSDHVRLVVESIMSKHRGETVLVVGHSNTVPAIIAALGAPPPAPISDADYANVYVVTVPASGRAGVVRAKY